MPGLQDYGRYRIELPAIDGGGMGIVFKAFDTVTRRPVAIKTLKGTPDPESLELFQKEWTILASLSHPNIVDILDIGEFTEDSERKPFFVMPLLPGRSLNKLIKSSGSFLNAERVVEIIFQASRGLQAAHDQRVIHRDLKPSNLFVMSDDTVKIIDFGIVHLADSKTRTGIKGTLCYMAPELLEFQPATARSDVFSLGVVCYEALTGRGPFDRPTQEETIEAIRQEMPRPVSDLIPGVNDQIGRVVHKSLAKKPYHRFSSAREFGDALRRALNNEALDLFDRSRIQPRLNRVRKALGTGDFQLGLEILEELESEGIIDADIPLLRSDLERAAREKTIQQLLEDARTRMEEEEYPLALQKVQSVLEIDPDNIDGLALKSDIERQRSIAQIDRWSQIARQHLANKFFVKARQAADEILKIDPPNKEARNLLAEIGVGEEQLASVRRERQQFYDSAHKAYSNGELSSALRLLERAIELGKGTPSHPNSDGRYLEFYEKVRREHDEIANAYADGKRALAASDFDRALSICNQVLVRRPREPLLQSLRIEVEDLKRQQNSAAVADLHRQIEAEFDLERKFAMLASAVEQFPGEQAFVQSLNVIKARRNLVNDIVRRARHYESQAQFFEAGNQWETLRTIYREYPGLHYEIQRLERKQEEHLKNQARARLLEQVDGALVSNKFERARDLLSAALLTAPEDDELRRLMRQTEEGLENSRRVESLFLEGQQFVTEGNPALAIERLREACRLEPSNQRVTRSFSSVLLEHARALAEKDWRSSAPVLEELLNIDPDNPGAAGVTHLISDMQRRERADACIEEARKLRQERALEQAVTKVELGLCEIPADTRLLQLRRELQRELEFIRTAKSPPVSRTLSAAAGASFSPPQIIRRSPDPSLPERTAGEVVPSLRQSEGSGFFVPEDGGREKDAGAPQAVIADQRVRASSSTAIPPPGGSARRLLRKLPTWIVQPASLAVVAGLILISLLSLGMAWMRHRANPAIANNSKYALTVPAPSPTTDSFPAKPGGTPSHTQPEPKQIPAAKPTPIPVRFNSEPPLASVKVDGDDTLKCQTPCELPLFKGRHTFSMTAPGYAERGGVLQVPQESTASVVLVRDLKDVRVVTVPAGIPISIDGEPRGEMPQTLKLSLGKHTLTFTNNGELYKTSFDVTDKDFVVVVTLEGGPSASTHAISKPPSDL
ncbi:MAG: protein kinase domain-containing protein [Bryobacteraceae bacterium]